MSDDLERTISESLDRHARRLGPRDAHLDAVWARLDRRRNRRRGVAAVGSVLAVGAGVTGIVMVGGGADAPAPGDGAPITTLAGVAWRCTGLFGDDGIYRYYTDCSPVAELPPLTSEAPFPATVPPTFPPTTAIVPAMSTAPPFTGPATTAPGTIVDATTAPAPLPSAPPTTSPLTTAPFPTEPPANTAPAGVDSIEYEVQMGDSLAGIASDFGVGPMDIVVANGWEGAEHMLLPGEIIVVPLTPAITAPPKAPVGSMVTPTTVSGPCEDASGTVPCPTLPPFDTAGPATTAPTAPSVSFNSFRCSGFLGHDGMAEYFAACELIGPDGAVQPSPSVLTGTLPATVAPTTGFGVVVTNPPVSPSNVPLITVPPTVDTVLPSVPPMPTTAGVVPILGVYEDVAFYPACGNETLDHEGTTWYPIVHVGGDPMDGTLQQLLDDVNSREREPSPVVGARGFARVSAPGPGDDVGTLVVWADGVARWVSASGSLDVVMTDEPVTYNWVC